MTLCGGPDGLTKPNHTQRLHEGDQNIMGDHMYGMPRLTEGGFRIWKIVDCIDDDHCAVVNKGRAILYLQLMAFLAHVPNTRQ